MSTRTLPSYEAAYKELLAAVDDYIGWQSWDLRRPAYGIMLDHLHKRVEVQPEPRPQPEAPRLNQPHARPSWEEYIKSNEGQRRRLMMRYANGGTVTAAELAAVHPGKTATDFHDHTQGRHR